MPISKAGKLYVTQAQIEFARACSALEYARRAGYDLVGRGGASGYYLREHDSMVFTADGRWFWNSRGIHGRALELLMYYEQRSFPMAVHILCSGMVGRADANLGQEPKEAPPKEHQPLELPEQSPTFRRLFAYLCKTRKLDGDIIKYLVRQGRIYESVRQYVCRNTGELRIAHNVVFVGMDEEGAPRSAFQRGTNTGAAFKRDAPGSDKTFAFCCPGREDVTTVAVFEAAIDAISHATIAKIRGEDWMDRDRIALGGLTVIPLLHYLETHKDVTQIDLCLDSDVYGRKGADRLTDELRRHGYDVQHGYTIVTQFPPRGKDWNEYLTAGDLT